MRKIYITILFSLLATISLYAAQVVVSEAPEYIESEIINPDPQATTVVANAPEEDLVAALYYNSTPLADGTTISQDTNNEALLLTDTWELTPFSIRITGSESLDYNLNIDLEVGFFQLLNDDDQVIQGEGGYTIDSQAMKIQNITDLEGVTFANNPIGSNIYQYSVPLSSSLYYSTTSMASFKLTWDAKDITQPGSYISNIQVTFSVD